MAASQLFLVHSFTIQKTYVFAFRNRVLSPFTRFSIWFEHPLFADLQGNSSVEHTAEQQRSGRHTSITSLWLWMLAHYTNEDKWEEDSSHLAREKKKRSCVDARGGVGGRGSRSLLRMRENTRPESQPNCEKTHLKRGVRRIRFVTSELSVTEAGMLTGS